MTYCLNCNRDKWNSAGTKAPDDIKSICREQGIRIFNMPYFSTKIPSVFRMLFYLFALPCSWIKLSYTLKKGDVVIYQHPLYSTKIGAYEDRLAKFFISQLQKNKDCKFIVLIHDLESLRGGITGIIEKRKADVEYGDNVLLKQFDVVICHNEYMRKYLINHGFDETRLVCLGIFDYICDFKTKEKKSIETPSIAIAGNLSHGKSPYIYNIYGQGDNQNSNLTLFLYGNDFDETYKQGDMQYQGSFKPEELPGKLKGAFGLVWDGTSIKTCTGNTGKYLKYNNPHKTSLYLASGMPVIVWSQAAIADFVLEHGVGIAVDNLTNLDDVISNISDNDYRIMCENVNEIGRQIRSGEYFISALKKSLDIISNFESE